MLHLYARAAEGQLSRTTTTVSFREGPGAPPADPQEAGPRGRPVPGSGLEDAGWGKQGLSSGEKLQRQKARGTRRKSTQPATQSGAAHTLPEGCCDRWRTGAGRPPASPQRKTHPQGKGRCLTAKSHSGVRCHPIYTKSLVQAHFTHTEKKSQH